MKFTSLIILNFFFLLANAQINSFPPPQLSAGTKQYLFKQEKFNKESPAPLEGFVYRKDASQQYAVSALIKVYPGYTGESLDAEGIKVNTRAENIWSVQVPLDKMNALIHANGIQYIDLDRPAVADLDSARKLTRVDEVQAGTGLPMGYNGEGVVVGIIDVGFDYTHPAFYDTSYTEYRIRKVWEQKNSTGPNPSGFSYGTEFSDSLAIVTKEHDVSDASHGTHVAGIAAGSGYGGGGNNSRFRGVAYKADLAMVAILPDSDYWLNPGMADFLDGINYIFDYASSVSKPAVANLSWSCPMGPRDGNSLFSQAVDNLTGPGKIFVLSAGNNGANNIHLQKIFSAADTSVSTVVSFDTGLPKQTNWVEAWGDTAQSLCIQFSLYNGQNKIDSTPIICLDNLTHDLGMKGSNNDSCFITLTALATEYNGKPHMLMDIFSKVGDLLCITITGSEGTVNLWQGYVLGTSGYYGSFAKQGLPFAVNGNSQMTMGDIACTKSAISIGAYNSKPAFTNIYGQALQYTGYTKGALTSFSSKGPTEDGRVFPFITAPGLALASAVNSVDPGFMQGGLDTNIVISDFLSPLNNVNYKYVVFAGTSMSSPMVSGITALLLDADPTLDPQTVKFLLKTSAIQDNFTGVIPGVGSNSWGYGKVNAYMAMLDLLTGVGIEHHVNKPNCLLYPNPSKGIYNIEFIGDKSEDIQLIVSDLIGQHLIKEVWNVNPGSNIHQVDLSNFPSGTFFADLRGKNGNSVIKIVKQ